MQQKKNAGILIQARTGSSRFPKKVLADIGGKPLIWHVLNRVKQSKITNVVLVTTQSNQDKILCDIAKQNESECYQGDTFNVLKRFYDCIMKYGFDPVIRITGDCPFIDPVLIDQMYEFFQTHDYDYVSNTIKPTYPDGLDVEIISQRSLVLTYRNATLASEKEHVTPYIVKNQEKFRVSNYSNDEDLSSLRWTVDQKKDLEFIRKTYALIKNKENFTTKHILHVLKQHPDLLQINSHIRRNEGYLKSLESEN